MQYLDANQYAQMAATLPSTASVVAGSGGYTPPTPFVTPEYQAPDPYKAPEYDEGRITDITQTQAAGAVRGLRSSIQRISGARYDNPNVKRMTLRDALAGYGQGMQSAMSKASESARSLYNQEYGMKADEAKTNYAQAAQAAQTRYQAMVQGELASYQTRAQAQAMQYQLDEQRKLTEYQTAWDNYNKEQQRQLAQQEINLKAQELAMKQQDYADAQAAKGPPPGMSPQFYAKWYNDRRGVYNPPGGGIGGGSQYVGVGGSLVAGGGLPQGPVKPGAYIPHTILPTYKQKQEVK